MRIGILAALLATAVTAAGAAGSFHWTASSTTAMSVTGDVTFSPDKVIFGNGQSLPIRESAKMPAFKDDGNQFSAVVYQVTVPANPKLKNGNTLCGNVPVTYVVWWLDKTLGPDEALNTLAFFSGATAPTGTGGKDFCGTYNYDDK